jgi:GT2 family glycosyltransferase
MQEPRVGVVVITWQRREEALAAVARLRALPEQPPLVLVDNGSTDGTAAAVRERFPDVDVVALPENLGAVGRNVGVARLRTTYVAFCDDDTWWEPGSLRHAADVLDAYPRLAVVNARIVMEPGGADDPIVTELRDSPVPGPDWLPGPALGSFLAGASVVRRSAFLDAGGFSPRLWLGGEEELLATDLLSAGWELCYLDDLVVHHQASKPSCGAGSDCATRCGSPGCAVRSHRRCAARGSSRGPCRGTAPRHWAPGTPRAGCRG